MLSLSNSIFLGSALIAPALSAVLPFDAENPYGDFGNTLEVRDDESFAPPGAPPMHPGQSLDDYLGNILSGTGPPANPVPSKEKRDGISGFNNSIKWTENDITYQIAVVDKNCDNAVRPSMIAGDIVRVNGEVKINATIQDIIAELYDIRKAHSHDVEAQEIAYAQFSNKQALRAWGDLIQLLDHGWICDSVDPTVGPQVLHDELRRKLLEMNKLQYYTFIIAGSAISGAVVAGIQAGITHGYSNVELGGEAYFNSAVGIALSIFLATEFSRFAPRIAGAESWSPVVLWAWGQRMVTRSGQALKRVRSSAGAMGGGAASAIINGGSGGGAGSSAAAPGCVPPDQARAGAETLMEQGLPQGSNYASQALDLGWQAASDSANIGAGTDGVGACRN